MIKMTNKRYADLSETEKMAESMVEGINGQNDTRDRFDFALSHGFIVIGVIITIITRLF